MHAVKHGMTSRQIAERRGISIDAVKYHVANALATLGLANRKELRHWHRAPKNSALKDTPMNAPWNMGLDRSDRAIGAGRQAVGGLVSQCSGAAASIHVRQTRLLRLRGDAADVPSEESRPRPRSRFSTCESATSLNAHELLKVQTRGVEFINAPHMIHRHADGTEEWLSMFKDPEGRPLGLMAQARP